MCKKMAELYCDEQHEKLDTLKTTHRVPISTLKRKLMGVMLAKCYKEISVGKAQQVEIE